VTHSRFPQLQAVAFGAVPQGETQELRFVQDRVALLGKVTFFISGTFLIAVGVADYLRQFERVQLIGRTSHALGTLLALAVWQLLARRRMFSPETLLAFDLLGTFCICASFIGMGYFAVQPYGYYTAMLAVTHVSITRAMVVPSEPRRTLLLGLASFAGFLVMRATLPETPTMLELGGRARGVVEAALWSAAGIAVSTVASRVIYGLVKRAREAQKLGQYTLEEKIGQGGMGEIYRARHAMLRRPTAVKLLLGNGSELQLRRFEKEVQLTARLTHPNTISIYDYGRTPDGVFYYAMELLQGMTLEELVRGHGPLPPARAIHLLQQACGALHEAHKIGLIHRDIKPANLFLCRRGEIADFVKVLDFGLVRELKGNDDTTQSNVSLVVGTPLYMSPEAIAEPERVDAATDVYGLGGVAYFLVTGSAPFHGKTVLEVCAHHLHSEPPPPSSKQGTVPADLERVILSCLEKSKEARPAGVRALSEALASCAAAGAWSPSDADAWWQSIDGAVSTASAEPSFTLASGEQTRRTLAVADLEHRLAEAKRSA
jgi:serine/threonine-protein kinase